MAILNKSIWIDAPLGLVFSYFTDQNKLSQWSGVAARLDPRPGGIYELDMGEAGVMTGRFISVEPQRIVHEIDGPDGGNPHQFVVNLTEEAGGTRVDIHHTGLQTPFDRIASRGWDHHLARLSVACGGGTPAPDSLCVRPMESLLD